MELFPSLLDLSNLGNSISDNRIIGNVPGREWLADTAACFQINEILLFIGNIFATLFWYWQLKKWGVQCIYDTAAEKTTTESIEIYRETLKGKNFSPLSIKAYLGDLQQFLEWLKKRRVD